MNKIPRRILLATDLSAHSDRAESRAVLLMKQFNAELFILHVIDPLKENRTIHHTKFSFSFIPNQLLVENAKRKLHDYLDHTEGQVSMRVENGTPHEIILRISEEEKCDLIVCGVSRNETLIRFTLGITVDNLIRKSNIPLLIISERANSPYRNIIAASDFSANSKHMLELSSAFFPDNKITVFHAHSAPGSYAVEDMDSY